MALFRKKPRHSPPVDKSDPASVIRDDIIGVSDWQRSKIGFITGFSSARRAVGNIGSSWSDAASRTSILWKELTKGDEVPPLEDGGDASERFAASMRLHRRTERDLKVILLNTYRAGLLYCGLTVAAIAFGTFSVYFYPPNGLFQTAARFSAAPILAALAFKHLYTNWMVRRRRLDGAGAFLLSREWLPVKP